MKKVITITGIAAVIYWATRKNKKKEEVILPKPKIVHSDLNIKQMMIKEDTVLEAQSRLNSTTESKITTQKFV
jgi:hypothetical protein